MLGSEIQKESGNIGLKIGVAGFAFGNIMLFSFPEYLGLTDPSFRQWFGIINILLSIPVVFYSGFDYLKASWVAVKQRIVDINIPIALGIIVLFIRSVYEITILQQAGYIDSLAGLIFFLLIGKWYQGRTYQYLSFEMDYRSYFPIAVTIIKNDRMVQTPIEQIVDNDRLLIKNNQIIPTDCTLEEEMTSIDYSFVTGESMPVTVVKNEKIYAGGRLVGTSASMRANGKVINSYLVSLWNNTKKKKEAQNENLISNLSKYFTAAVLLIASFSFIFWIQTSLENAILTSTAVLIVACPCALALSVPFIYGNALRLLAKKGIFLKKAEVLEDISKIDFIAFDKTGTLTSEIEKQVSYEGKVLTDQDRRAVHALTFQSIHPLSIAIEKILRSDKIGLVKDFKEISGTGISGEVEGRHLKLGKLDFVSTENRNDAKNTETSVYLSINGQLKGRYIFHHHYRPHLKDTINTIYRLGIQMEMISGDSDQDRNEMEDLFGKNTKLLFRQSPDQKFEEIKAAQEHHRVAMIGDGLNDAAALQQSDLGIVITNDTNNFSPASDIIFSGNQFHNLGNLFLFGKRIKQALYGAFLLALIYNIVGLYLAVTGQLSPIYAAILMPLSSISVVVYALIITPIIQKRVLQ